MNAKKKNLVPLGPPQALPQTPNRVRWGVSRHIRHWCSRSVKWASIEWLLTSHHWENGGAAIFVRSTLIASQIYFVVLALKNGIDPELTWTFSEVELRRQLIDTLPWFGTIFAGVYIALYSRFASQWTYLANVYNQIKAAECKGECEPEALAEWKAGFIEDADELHLVDKRLFASVLHAWGHEKSVKEKFIHHASGGDKRFEKLMNRVDNVFYMRSCSNSVKSV